MYDLQFQKDWKATENNGDALTKVTKLDMWREMSPTRCNSFFREVSFFSTHTILNLLFIFSFRAIKDTKKEEKEKKKYVYSLKLWWNSYLLPPKRYLKGTLYFLTSKKNRKTCWKKIPSKMLTNFKTPHTLNILNLLELKNENTGEALEFCFLIYNYLPLLRNLTLGMNGICTQWKSKT